MYIQLVGSFVIDNGLFPFKNTCSIFKPNYLIILTFHSTQYFSFRPRSWSNFMARHPKVTMEVENAFLV